MWMILFAQYESFQEILRGNLQFFQFLFFLGATKI